MSGSNVNNYMRTCHEESMFESALQMNNDILLLLNDNYSPKDNENNCRYQIHFKCTLYTNILQQPVNVHMHLTNEMVYQ